MSSSSSSKSFLLAGEAVVMVTATLPPLPFRMVAVAPAGVCGGVVDKFSGKSSLLCAVTNVTDTDGSVVVFISLLVAMPADSVPLGDGAPDPL